MTSLFVMLEPNHNSIAKRYRQALYKAGIPLIFSTTSDTRKEHEKLLGLGARFRNEPSRSEYGIEALFEDGFGNIIQVYEA